MMVGADDAVRGAFGARADGDCMARNFCRPRMTKANGGFRQTPAMAAVVADHVSTIAEILALLSAEKAG